MKKIKFISCFSHAELLSHVVVALMLFLTPSILSVALIQLW